MDRLIDGLWGDGDPRDVANVLQHQVSRLREVVGGELVLRRGPGYVLDVPPEAVDVRRFERLAEEGHAAFRRGDPGASAVRLRSALALWRGPAMDGLPALPWVVAEEVRMAGLWLMVPRARRRSAEELRAQPVDERAAPGIGQRSGAGVGVEEGRRVRVGHRIRQHLVPFEHGTLRRQGRHEPVLPGAVAAGHVGTDHLRDACERPVELGRVGPVDHGQCACRIPRPCSSSGMLILVKDAAEPVSSA